MKRRLSWLMAALLPACLSFGQTTQTLLWKISGKGLEKPSYLFGTMHILCADDARLSDTLKKVIAACDKVYFEINLSDMAGMLGSMRYMQMNEGQTLRDLLAPADYTKVDDYFHKHRPGLPFALLQRFKPMLISGLIEEEGLECSSTDGMELSIMKQLKPYHTPVDGLETVEFQSRLFDSIPYREQAKLLVGYIDSAEQNKQMSRELADLYRKQDLEKIDELTRNGEPGMEKYMNLLLYDRNRKWAEMLPGLLAGHSLLIAVGAAHLPGENGVIDLLKKKGFQVTPVVN